MGYEGEGSKEKLTISQSLPPPNMTLQKAVDMGEYDPQYLAKFPEWGPLSRHVRLQFIRQGLDNRRKNLLMQWAELNNVLDFSQKPHIKTALRNIERQLKNLEDDREKIYLEYSKSE